MDTLTRKDPSIERESEMRCWNCASFESAKRCRCTQGNHEYWTPRKGGEEVITPIKQEDTFSQCDTEGRGGSPLKTPDYMAGYVDGYQDCHDFANGRINKLLEKMKKVTL